MAYISLYRKYRPKTFSDVVGQEIIIKILENSILNEKIGHAYIFSGTRGTGKTSVAKIFAKAVNCLSNKNGDACLECEACKNIEVNDIDIVEIDAASNNGVEEIREIRNNVKLMPTYVKYKVYIIDEVHMLSSSAFNALLKTLEEPPSHVIFVLATTELHKVPATVLSRCQKFEFKKISKKDIISRLKFILNEESRTVNEEVLSLIANLSDGGLRDAINLLDQLISLNSAEVTADDVYNLLGDVPDDTIFNIMDSLINNNIKVGLDIIKELSDNGKNFTNICDRLQSLIRNIIIYNSTSNYFDKEYEKKLEKYSKVSIDNETLIATSLFELNNELKKTTNQKTLFEIYYIKISTSLSTTKEEKNSEEKKPIEFETINKEVEFVDNSYKKRRVKNTLAEADKEIKKEMLKEYDKIKDYLSSKEYNSIANLMNKANLEVSSKRNILFTFKNSFEVVLFDKNIIDITKFLKVIFNKNYDIVAISSEEWKETKSQYINDNKNGIKYEYVAEEKREKNKRKNPTVLESTAESMFGDDLVTVR